MLQGGDPTGTGSGGDSHFGGTFEVSSSVADPENFAPDPIFIILDPDPV